MRSKTTNSKVSAAGEVSPAPLTSSDPLTKEEKEWLKELAAELRQKKTNGHHSIFPPSDRKLKVERHGLNDINRLLSFWRRLDSASEHELQTERYEEISNRRNNLVRKVMVDGEEMLFGRYQYPYPDTDGIFREPVFWISVGSRILLSCDFEKLPEHDQMAVARVIVKSFAEHFSRKTDLRSAALILTEAGKLHFAFNTQEHDTMAIHKECAEANAAIVAKQLNYQGKKVKKIFVYGALVDQEGKIATRQKMIGMCMRCVEAVYPVMASNSDVIMFLAGDKEDIRVSHAEALSEMGKDRTVWKIPYDHLKGPSIIQFDEHTSGMQKEEWDRIVSASGKWKVRHISQDRHAEKRLKPSKAHEWLYNFVREKIKERDGDARHVVGAVAEISNGSNKNTFRYFLSGETIGEQDNAVWNAVSMAVGNAGIKMSRKDADQFVSKIYVMGYNADGSPLNLSTEGWDRVVKRIGDMKRLDKTMVDFLPFTADYHPKRVITKSMKQLAATVYTGSKQLSCEVAEKKGGDGWAGYINASRSIRCEAIPRQRS